MDLGTLRRMAAEWVAAVRGKAFSGMARLDPRKVELRLGDVRVGLILDEQLCGIALPSTSPALPGLPTSLQYLAEALAGFVAADVVAEPGRLRLLGERRHGLMELSLVGPPRSFLLLLRDGEPIAGYRRPSDRSWTAGLPGFDPRAGDGPPSEALLRELERDYPEALRETALARLSRGLTPALAREIRHRAGRDRPEPLAAAASAVLAEAAGPGPARLYLRPGHPPIVTGARLSHESAPAMEFTRVVDAVNAAETERLQPERLAAFRRAAAREFERRSARAERTLQKLDSERSEVDDRTSLERQAHTLMAHGSRLPRGRTQAELPDLEDPEKQLAIALDPMLTGMENATALLRRAAKLGRRTEVVQTRIREVSAERDRARTEAERVLKSAGWRELEAMGVLAEERVSPEAEVRKDEAARNEPLKLESEDGWTLLIGRNDRQNEFLTHHLARPRDLWFHAEHVPGSHVVLRIDSRAGEPSARTLQEAASYAAFMSKSRSSSSVPVIVAEKRYVRKARGGPGKVTVDRAKSLMVTPRKPGG